MIRQSNEQLWSPPIWVDFMRIDWEGNIKLDAPGTINDLAKWDIDPTEGRRLVLREADANDRDETDDLIAVGTMQYDPDEQRWVAIDWEPTCHFSELDAESRRLYRAYRPENGERRR